MAFRLNYRLRRIAAVAIFAFAGPASAWAAFPDKPLKLAVPYMPGGSADQLSRVLAEGLSRDLGQPVVVENKPGANTMVAATQVARSAPDGYTIFLASNASMVLNPMLYQRIAYDAARDFRVLSIAAELLKSRTGMDVAHIPYNGSAPALTSLMANDTQLMVDVISTSLPLVRERKIKALAVTTAERLAVLPDVPTVADSGFPGFRAATWFGLAVPRAVPQAEAQRLQADVDAYVQEDRKRWGAVIEANRIRLD
ncbi:Bug family tripartite tricarboxylate transporter substrate binding protein [Achromobacter agilis]|uniref:Tripartite tricarboxylate transporter family receptor n=1 Tax=Achromobacter agilis TaxID=1353888 RepID=A0A446CLD1_9BURK|nr:tripartite tricarboxylate transporter substrate-binding protein [Achromobacter agilis]SSW68736.1 hypothetical protein AGI3411_03792 [Achromobacter agilis]